MAAAKQVIIKNCPLFRMRCQGKKCMWFDEKANTCYIIGLAKKATK